MRNSKKVGYLASVSNVRFDSLNVSCKSNRKSTDCILVILSIIQGFYCLSRKAFLMIEAQSHSLSGSAPYGKLAACAMAPYSPAAHQAIVQNITCSARSLFLYISCQGLPQQNCMFKSW